MRCKEYYLNKGYNEAEACNILHNVQGNYSKRWKGHKEYWINVGFSNETAVSLEKEYASKSSVWSKKYWMRMGYTEEDSHKKVLEYNPSSVFFKGYNDDINKFYKRNLKVSEDRENKWKSGKYLDSAITNIKNGKMRHVSKEEVSAFDFLIKNVDDRIIHEPYIVIIPSDKREYMINSYFYVTDGYLDTGNGIIIIEYDGKMFHNKLLDEKRDFDILSIDENVLGIIHILQGSKGNRNNKIKLLEVKNAIQKITNTTESRIIL